MLEKDITGKIYGRLIAIKRSKSVGSLIKWLFVCRCSTLIESTKSEVIRGRVKSCGCLRENMRNVTHGMTNTKFYNTWLNMRQRCNNPNSTHYRRYGGRGITVGSEWDNSFQAFYNDMFSTYSDNLTIDRVNNEKGYSKHNCRWITQKEQMRNTSANREVSSYRLNGELKNKYTVLSDVVKDGFSVSGVIHACKWTTKTHGKLVWEYSDLRCNL